MKSNIIIKLGLLLAAVGLLGSCNSAPEYYTLEAPEDQMQVQSSVDTLLLERTKKAETAATFTWNDAHDRGAGTSLTYYIRFYLADSKDKISDLLPIPSGNSYALSTQELNNYLSNWGVAVGEAARVTAEVIAQVNADARYFKPEISETTIVVTGYDPRDLMYILIPSSEGDRSIQMDNIPESGIYHWHGGLEPCEFWFSTSTTGTPAYVKGASDTQAVYSADGTGSHFTITEPADYDITLDLNTGTLTVNKIPYLYLVQEQDGNTGTTRITNIDTDSLYYHWSGRLQAGTRLRFATSDANTWPAYVPTAAGSDEVRLADEGAPMLTIPTTGRYEITLCLKNNKLICLDVYDLPFGGMWAVGNAVPSGWDAGNQTCPFVQSDLKHHPEIWTLTTDITAGNEFKLITRPGEWNYEFLRADSETRQDPVNTWLNSGIRSAGVSGDNKYTPSKGGRWTIKADLHNMRLIMVQ